jgi:hypothetical protein
MDPELIRIIEDNNLQLHGDIEYFAEIFAEMVAQRERDLFPNLDPVIAWLENGCDPKEAAKELRLYAEAIRKARGEA